MNESYNLPYSSHQAFNSNGEAALQFDFYAPDGSSDQSPLIVFVRGGAWIADDKNMHKPLARALALASQCCVAVPNYRLSSQERPADNIYHPEHAYDILRALEFLRTWQGPDPTQKAYNSDKLILIGHSAGGHILTSLFLDPPAPVPQLAISPELLNSVRGIVTTEGIFDIDRLLQDFPTYTFFTGPAFGDGPSYRDVSTNHFSLKSTHIRWMIVHSSGDTLVNLTQAEIIFDRLTELYRAAGVVPGAWVLKEWSAFTSEHDDVLKEPGFAPFVADFIKRAI